MSYCRFYSKDQKYRHFFEKIVSLKEVQVALHSGAGQAAHNAFLKFDLTIAFKIQFIHEAPNLDLPMWLLYFETNDLVGIVCANHLELSICSHVPFILTSL